MKQVLPTAPDRGIVTRSSARTAPRDYLNAFSGIADTGNHRARRSSRVLWRRFRGRRRRHRDPAPGATVPPRPADRPGNNLGHGRAECAARLLAIPAAGRDRSAHRRRPGLFGYGVYLPGRSLRHRTRPPRSASGICSVSGDPRSDHCLSHPTPVFAPARPRTAPLGLVGAHSGSLVASYRGCSGSAEH